MTQDGRAVILEPGGTWKYPVTPRDLTAIVRARPHEARLLQVGRQVAYGIWIDPWTWRLSAKKDNAAAEYEFVHVNGGAWAVIIPEVNAIPPESWKQIIVNNAQKIAADAHITREEKTTVNGVDVLLLQTEGTAPDGPFVYYGYYYAGQEGAIQIVASTRADRFDQYLADFKTFLNGFVLLVEDPGEAEPAAPPAPAAAVQMPGTPGLGWAEPVIAMRPAPDPSADALPANGAAGTASGAVVTAPAATVESDPPATVAANQEPPAPVEAPVAAVSAESRDHRIATVGKYWVQVGAFKEVGNAEDLAKALRRQGYAVQVTPGVVLHFVRVGGFADRGAAATTLRELQAKGHPGFVVQGENR
jgi:cell division septation protein DedD